MNIDLDCSLRDSEHTLELVYTLRNGGPSEAGVFNRIETVGADGMQVFSPNTIYLEILDGTLVAQKAALPKPTHLQMTVYIPPYATRIPAFGQLTETVAIPVPVTVVQPFRRALLKGQVVADVPTTVSSVMLSIGVFQVDDECRLVAENPAHPQSLTALQPGIAVFRQVVLSRRFSLRRPIVVYEYRAVPWNRTNS